MALAILLSAETGACTSRVPEASPRLVVLYATCSLNKSFLAPYNSSVAYTPSLSKLAQSSLVFDRHETEAGQSGIAFASIFSGMQAPGHGIFSHPNRLDDKVLLITEAFAAAGYDTYAFLGHRIASVGMNYAQGVRSGHARRSRLTAGNRLFASVLKRLQADPNYKAFIVTDFTVTHSPYHGTLLDSFCKKYPGECDALADRPAFDRFRRIYQNNLLGVSWDFDATMKRLHLGPADIGKLAATLNLLYKADVYLLDKMIGDLVQEVDDKGLLDQTLLAFTSDHGEIHYRENAPFKWTHGYQLAPEYLDVALILKGPGIKTGRYGSVTRSIDVFPTLAGLAGVALPFNAQRGVDLSAAILGQEPPPHLLAFSHTTLMDPPQWRLYKNFAKFRALFPNMVPDEMWVAVRDGDRFFKRRRDETGIWRTSLYDMAVDPGETTDLFNAADPAHARMSDALTSYKEELVAAALKRRSGTVPPKQALERLRSLGYVK